MSLYRFVKSSWECVLQYRPRSILPLQTNPLRFYVPVHTVVALQLLLPTQYSASKVSIGDIRVFASPL